MSFIFQFGTLIWCIAPNGIVPEKPQPNTTQADENDKVKPVRLITRIQAKGFSPYGCAFFPDGRRFAIGTAQNAILIWDVKTNKKIGKLRHDSKRKGIKTVAVSPNGKYLASQVKGGRKSGSVWIWNVKTRKPMWKLDQLTSSSDIAFSPDGKHIAIVDFFHLYLSDVKTGKKLWKHKIDPGLISHLRYSPDGNKLVFSGYGYDFVRMLNPKKKIELAKLDFNVSIATAAVAFSQDGSKLFVGGCNSAIWVCDLSNKGKLTALEMIVDNWVRFIDVVAEDRLLIVADNKRNIYFWDLKARKKIFTFQSGYGGPLFFSVADNVFATVEPTGDVTFWEYSQLVRKNK